MAPGSRLQVPGLDAILSLYGDRADPPLSLICCLFSVLLALSPLFFSPLNLSTQYLQISVSSIFSDLLVLSLSLSVTSSLLLNFLFSLPLFIRVVALSSS